MIDNPVARKAFEEMLNCHLQNWHMDWLRGLARSLRLFCPPKKKALIGKIINCVKRRLFIGDGR